MNKNKMKIGVYHNVPPGGAKRAVYEEVKYLSKKHELFVFRLSSTDESFLDIRPFIKKVKTYKFDLKSKLPGYLNRLEKDYKNFVVLDQLHERIAKDIDEMKLNVVLVHPDKFTQAPFLLRYLKTPPLYFCEEYLRIVYEKELEFNDDVIFYKRWYEGLTRAIRKNIDRDNAGNASTILANSRFTKRNIDKVYNVKSKVCHLGVDINVFKKSSKVKGDYILYIGEKGTVGDLKLLEKSVMKIKYKDRPRIKRLGYSKDKLDINDDNILAKEYSKALITICTQHSEPFGLAPIESMACETPVLAVDEGGYRETIVNDVTGFLLPRDPDIFTKKIEYLINNPKVALKMGKTGRDYIKKNFTWEKHCKTVESELVQTTS